VRLNNAQHGREYDELMESNDTQNQIIGFKADIEDLNEEYHNVNY